MNLQQQTAGETAFAFSCQGDELIGFIHEGDRNRQIGVLTLVAGGPQYRGGVGRQLVRLGRRLASEGMTLMRFDHRGLGDSEGSYLGFRHIQDDIAAAIAEFRRRAPWVTDVVLWGGCDSATAALIHAHKLPAVVGIIAGNPFVSSAASAAKATRRHYLSRLGEMAFWRKLARGGYPLGDYVAHAWRTLCKQTANAHKTAHDTQPNGSAGNFIDDVLTGLQRFDGKVLFLMGDRFLRSDEFDALITSSPEWRAAYGKASHERIDIQGGDQVFSTREAQDRLFDAASAWLQRTFPAQSRHAMPAPQPDDHPLLTSRP